MIEDFKRIIFGDEFDEISISKLRNIKNSILPKSLYKYRSLNNYTLESLRTNSIWLASPNTLNDPYDCFISLDAEEELNQIPKDVLRLLSCSEVVELENEISNGNTSIEAFFNMFSKRKNFSKKGLAERNKIKETIFGVINDAIASFERDSKRLRESLGICSFAQECDSILMWSHYAQSHQGICIEYDVNCFEDHLINNLYPVMYEDILFDFRKLVDEFSKYPIRTNLLISLVKSKVWSYEKEWRIVSPLIRNQNVSICKPKSVYLGAYISEVFENEIKSICASQGIEVFKMKNEKKKFSLIATKIS